MGVEEDVEVVGTRGATIANKVGEWKGRTQVLAQVNRNTPTPLVKVFSGSVLVI
jgi:hypothetical protein